MQIIEKRKKFRLFFILIMFVFIFIFASYIYKDNNKISNTWNILFSLSTPLEEPKEILSEYSSRGGFHGDGIEIYLMDVSNWNMEEVMNNFTTKKIFLDYDEMERYCKDNLYFSEEDSEALSQKFSEVFSKKNLWAEVHSKENTEDVLAIYYNPDNQKCLLLVSCI